MMRARNVDSARRRDATLAKLVIGIAAAVALATASTPPWGGEDEQSWRVTLDDSSTRKLLLTIELGGALYADAASGWTELTLTTDRDASDLTFVIERLGSSRDGSSASSSDAGVEGDQAEWRWVASFTREAPARASRSLQLACPPSDLEPRQETCVDQLEITLARASTRPLQALLIVATEVIGQQAKRPTGTFAVSLEEVAP